ncbi:MAG: hypothetical protein AB7V26_14115 [Lysobacterales bacterium]
MDAGSGPVATLGGLAAMAQDVKKDNSSAVQIRSNMAIFLFEQMHVCMVCGGHPAGGAERSGRQSPLATIPTTPADRC